LDFNGKLYKDVKNNRFVSYKLIRYNAKQLSEDLNNNFNITRKKSLSLKPPNLIKKEHIYSFIIGYIDGDGCISITKRDKHRPALHLQLCGTFKMMEWIKKNLKRLCPKIKNKIIFYKNVCTLQICGKNAYMVLTKLNDFNVPKLIRKWNKINEFNNLKKEVCRKNEI
jgi:hypothetical protein